MSRRYPAAFIHFGLGKCASTFLQTVWLNDPLYSYAPLQEAASIARKAAAEGYAGALPQIQLGERAKAGTQLVGSSEGFTWAYLKRPHVQPRIPELQALSARLIAENKLTNTALIMVRHPIKWTHSAYEQIIKEGGSLSGADFVNLHRHLIQGVLDLRHIRDVFEARFENVVILAADQLQESPEAFWSDYAKALNVPKPQNSTLEAVAANDRLANRSLKNRLGALIRLNATLQGVRDTWQTMENLPDFAEKERQVLFGGYDRAAIWGSRRVVEFADDDRLESLIAQAGGPLSPDYTEVPISDALKAFLSTRFCDAIEDVATIPDTLKTAWREAVSNA